MRFQIVSLLTLLLPLAVQGQTKIVPPTDPNRLDERWTLLNAQRICTDSLCVYRFAIFEGILNPVRVCSLTVPVEPTTIPPSPASPPQDQTTNPGGPAAAAYQTDFYDRKCDGLDTYLVSSGWNRANFSVITVKNVDRWVMAYFGFEDAELANAKEALPHTELTYRMDGWQQKRKQRRGAQAEHKWEA